MTHYTVPADAERLNLIDYVGERKQPSKLIPGANVVADIFTCPGCKAERERPPMLTTFRCEPCDLSMQISAFYVHVWRDGDRPMTSDGNIAQAQANARLIAAAPDMLAALKTVCSVLANREITKRDDELWAAFSWVVAAIAKADAEVDASLRPFDGAKPEAK